MREGMLPAGRVAGSEQARAIVAHREALHDMAWHGTARQWAVQRSPVRPLCERSSSCSSGAVSRSAVSEPVKLLFASAM
jgi:hypothetical protein